MLDSPALKWTLLGIVVLACLGVATFLFWPRPDTAPEEETVPDPSPAAQEPLAAEDGKVAQQEPPQEIEQGQLTEVAEPIHFRELPEQLDFNIEHARCAAFAPTGDRLATGHGHRTTRGEVRVWDIATGEQKTSFPEPRGVFAVAFSPEGGRLVSVNYQSEVTVRDTTAGTVLYRLRGHAARIRTVAFSPDGTRMATGSYDRMAQIWDVRTGRRVARFKADEKGVRLVAFSSDGKRLLSANDEGRFRWWDITLAQPTKTVEYEKGAQIRSIALSPDGRLFAGRFADSGDVLKFWDPGTGADRGTLSGEGSASTFTWCIALSPDGETLATLGETGDILLWDTKTTKMIAQLSVAPEGGAVTFDMAFSSTGREIAATNSDGTITVWSVAKRTVQQTLGESPREQVAQTSVLAVTTSPDGKWVASGHASGMVRIRDSDTGEAHSALPSHSAAVVSLVFGPDGSKLATAGEDATIKLWDVVSGELEVTLEGHTQTLYAIDFSPDGATLVSGGGDASVRLWDVAGGRERGKLDGHIGPVRAVAFSDDGRLVASGSEDQTVRVWDASGKTPHATLTGHSAAVRAVAFAPDGKTLASAAGNTIKLWNVDAGQERASLQMQTKSLSLRETLGRLIGTHPATADQNQGVRSLVFSPRGRTLAACGSSSIVALWDPASGQARVKLNGHGPTVNALAFSPDGWGLIGGSDTGSVLKWRATASKLATVAAHEKSARFVGFSPDGKTMITGGLDQVAKTWEIETKERIQTLSGHPGAVTCGAISPDGQVLATGGYATAITLWDTKTGKGTGTLRGHADRLAALAFSPDGRKLASGSWDQTARIWDVATKKSLTTLPKQLLPVVSLDFSPDGSLLATGTGSWREWQTPGEVTLWRVDSSQKTASLDGHLGSVNCVRFSADGAVLAVGSADSTVILWDVAARSRQKLLQHFSGVQHIRFLPESNLLMTVEHPRSVVLWDWTKGKLLSRFRAHAKPVFSLDCSPDGMLFATASDDGTVNLWSAFR